MAQRRPLGRGESQRLRRYLSPSGHRLFTSNFQAPSRARLMDCDSTFPRLKLGRKQSISLGSWKPLTYSRNRKKTVTRICVVNGFVSLSRGRPGGRVILTPARRPEGRDTNPLTTNGFPTNNVVNGRERTTTLFVHLFLSAQGRPKAELIIKTP